MKKYRIDIGKLLDPAHELPRIYDIDDRYRHTYILGKTGTGKSTLMLNMALYDIQYGCSVVFIDPKGDMVQKLESAVPEDRLVKLSIDNPIQINPLRKSGYNLSDLVEEFVEILDVLITLTASNRESTVLMQEIITNAIKAFKPSYRNAKFLVDFLMHDVTRLKYLQENEMPPAQHRYWTEFDAKERNGYPKNREKVESAKRVASRLSSLISDERMEKIIAKDNKFDIAEFVSQGKVLLVDTSKISSAKKIFISNLVTHAIKSHCEFIGNEYPLMVYVDEFQLCVSPLFANLLATARSKHIGFVLAHQNIDQLSKSILGSVFGNCNAFISFNCGYIEANTMAQVFGLKYEEFANLGKYEAWFRNGNNNTKIKTFSPPQLKEKYNFLSTDWI